VAVSTRKKQAAVCRWRLEEVVILFGQIIRVYVTAFS